MKNKIEKADMALTEAITGSISAFNPLFLAINTGFLLAFNFSLVVLGYFSLYFLSWLIGWGSLDNLELLNASSILYWVVGAYLVYLYRTNPIINRWVVRWGYRGNTVMSIVVIVGLLLVFLIFGIYPFVVK